MKDAEKSNGKVDDNFFFKNFCSNFSVVVFHFFF